MILFRISGTLPAPWEDFIPMEKGYPRFTLMTAENASLCGAETSDGSDGWFDRVLEVEEIDAAVARATIGGILGVDPVLIDFVEEGFAQST